MKAVPLGIFILLCASLAEVIGCHGSGATTGVSALGEIGPPTDVEPSVQEIADRVDRVYREARFIQLEGTISRVGHMLRFQYVGTQDSFRTIVFEGPGLYSAFSFHGGRIQEFVPDHPKRLLLIYDADRDNQIERLVYGRPLECLFGVQMGLWIGPKSGVSSYIVGDRIREGRLLGHEVVEDHACYVVEWEHEWAPNEKGAQRTRQVYYVDIQDSVLRRYDTIRDAEPQTRVYHVMDLHSDVPDVDWNIWPSIEGIVQAKPGTVCEEISSLPGNGSGSSNSTGGSEDQ